jgi:hypothetical protein
MGLPKTHTFNGKKYSVYFGPLKGLSDVSRNRPLSLYVRTTGLSASTILNITIHEALHACEWNSSEKKVDRVASDVSRLLWRLGYRLRKHNAKL